MTNYPFTKNQFFFARRKTKKQNISSFSSVFFIKTAQKIPDLEFISHYSLFLDFSKTFRSTRTNAFFRKEY